MTNVQRESLNGSACVCMNFSFATVSIQCIISSDRNRISQLLHDRILFYVSARWTQWKRNGKCSIDISMSKCGYGMWMTHKTRRGWRGWRAINAIKVKNERRKTSAKESHRNVWGDWKRKRGMAVTRFGHLNLNEELHSSQHIKSWHSYDKFHRTYILQRFRVFFSLIVFTAFLC